MVVPKALDALVQDYVNLQQLVAVLFDEAGGLHNISQLSLNRVAMFG